MFQDLSLRHLLAKLLSRVERELTTGGKIGDVVKSGGLSIESRLSLSKGSLMVVDEFADYCSVVLSDLRKRDVRKEDKLIERFKTEYCRL